MSEPRCPGQDLRYLKPEDVFDIRCPYCKKEVEFFKDEPSLRCPSCHRRVRNPKIDLGCAKWCAYAKECLGAVDDESDEIAPVCDRLILEVQTVFGSDRRRIDHALKVLDFAERIARTEGGDPLVVRAAAILHDIGIPEAERKHGSCTAKLREIEGPPVARAIMERLELDESVVDHVCRIIGSRHSGKDIDTPEFRIVWDADWLVNIPGEHSGEDREKTAALIAKTFKTGKGRAMAEKLFLQDIED